MPSSSFRLISAAISIFLLAALVTVIIVAIRDNSATALPLATPTGSLAQARAASAEATLAAAPTLSADTIEAVTPTPTDGTAENDAEMDAEVDAPETVTPDDAAQSAAGSDTEDTEDTTATVTPQTAATPAATEVAIPEAATATPEITPIAPIFDLVSGPTVSIYSNGNFVNGVASLRATLWAATSGGVVAWNKSTGSHVKFTTVDGLASNQTFAPVSCALPGLGILFAAPVGIQIFDTQNGTWKTLNSSNSTMRYDDVATLWCSAEDGLLVVGYTRQGIDIFDARAGTWSYIGPDEGLEVNGIRDIAIVDARTVDASTTDVTTDGTTVWLATQNGLVAYGIGENTGQNRGEATLFTTANSPLVDNRIEAIAADGAGAIWLTSADTLYRTDGEEWDTYDASGGDFPSGRLIGLDVSSNGAIWLGSDQTQVCRFDPGVEGCIGFYRDQEGMAAAPLTSLTIDSDGAVYYTTAGGGISAYDGSVWRQLVIPDEVTPGNIIRHITQATDGEFWLAGNGGVSRFIPDSSTPVQSYTPGNSPLPSVNVNVIFPTDTGVWFGTENATFFDGVTWITYGAEEGLTGNAVQAITADAQNRIWLGTNAGLSIWTGSAFFNLTSSNGLPSEDITALQTDGEAVWIGTRGGGLLRFQDNQLQLFNRNNSNLPGDTIYGMARAADGDLLIASDQGLARYTGSELSVYPDLAGQAIIALASAPNGEIWVATAIDDLLYFNGVEWTAAPTDQLPSPQINILMFDADGTLWIGTERGGLARYLP